ncbi:hypothetical protein [Legionella micdadei]|uniref:Interaptin n=2 Tax=Legionella micdadei TaxID=451 RepID=A0A098GIT9_LEGMI|nr:hypothetical protein [Legionella micdadei]KTD26395.1 interaptin [Legionella micdadei]CEG61890.1 protein of unknown function [Legionella micdadei]SCY66287.1 hypothetical protein SAMN02982997_02402 [Legionella micdadei]
MAYHNDELLAALDTIRDYPPAMGDQQNQVVGALDEILKAGYGGGAANTNFRKAIIDNAGFWNRLGVNITGTENPGVDTDFAATGVGGTRRKPRLGNPSNNFETLYKTVAERRVMLALREANEAQLEAIISEADNNEARKLLFGTDGKSIFGGQQVTLPAWDHTNENVITDQAITRIKEEAQRQLLIQKIAALGDKGMLDALLMVQNQVAFTAAVRGIFGLATPASPPPHPIADAMDIGRVFTHKVERAAIKKGAELLINSLSDRNVLHIVNGVATNIGGGITDLLDCNPGDFRTRFQSVHGQDICIHNLGDSDVVSLQGQLGARYLAANYATLRADRSADLERIAEAVTEVALKATIAPRGGPAMPEAGAYIDHAVTAATLPSIRQAAAKQALKLKIAQCDDATALGELISVTNADELKQKLARLNALGYTTKNEFRNALTGASVDDIVAMAHIRKNLAIIPTDPTDRAKHLTNLKDLILDPNFTAKYLNTFAAGQPAGVQNVLSGYFGDVAQITAARELALLSYLEQKLGQLSDPEITNLAAAVGNHATVKDLIKPLLGLQLADPALDHLITDADNGIGLQIRSYAAAEKIIRDAKSTIIDVSTKDAATAQAHTELLDKINNPRSAHLNNLVTAPTFPAKEKQRVRASLVESLVRNFPADRIPPLPAPPTPDRLTALAKAADIDKFKDALRDIGVTEHDWVNPKTMEQIQKAACAQIIKLDLSKVLPLGNENNRVHPKLIELIEQLPLSQQRALLEKDKALISLSQVTEPQEVDRILGARNIVDDSFVNALVDENEKLADLARIPNSEVAKVLAKIAPPLNLTPQQITQISDHILNGPNLFDDTAGVAPNIPFIQTVQAIAGFINHPNPQVIYNAFGLDNLGANLGATPEEQAIRTAIRDQETRNQHVQTLYSGALTDESKDIYRGIAGLSKSSQITQRAATAIHDAIKSSTTYSDFIATIKRPAFNPHLAAFSPPGVPALDKQLTPKLFAQIKVEARKKTLLNPGTYEEEFKEQGKVVKSLRKDFSDLKLNSASSALKRLAKARPIYWFNPAFQAASKENAKKMGSQFRELSEICDTMIAHLKQQIEQLEDQGRSLPNQTEIRASAGGGAVKRDIMDKVSERTQELIVLLDEMEKELKEYEKLQLLFKGNPGSDHPLLKQGLLTTLKQAEEGKKDIRVKGFHSYAVDYPIDQKRAHFAPTWQGEGVRPADQNGVSIKTGVPAERFEITDMVSPGKFREYTVYYDTVDRNNQPAVIKSTYIEERGAGNLAGQVGTGGVTQYSAELTLTANKFPPRNNPEARVHQAMEMATRILAARGKPPTIDDPIILDGPKDQIEFAWTALMAIGKNDPNMRFDASAIVIDNAQFSPDSQLGILGRWKGDSIFKKHFETHPSYTGLLKGIKEVDKLKFGKQEQKAMETARKDSAELMQFYKTKYNVLTGVKQKVSESDDTIPPPTPPAA